MAPAYRLVTVAMLLLTTMIAFESMAVTTAMPRAADELDAGTSYGLAFSSMLTAMLLGIAIAGSWADRSGPLPGMYAGQGFFALGLVGCAVATSFPALLGGRIVTGLGAGLVLVVEFVAIGRAYPGPLRPRVFTWISAAWVLPSVVGAPVAGWLAATLSWRWVFWVAIVPALLSMALITAKRSAFVGDDADDDGEAEVDRAEHRRATRLGSVVALGAGVFQLAIHERWPLGSLGFLAGAAGLVALAAAAPRMLPAGTFRLARGLPSVVLSRGLLNGVFNGAILFVPLMFAEERGVSLTVAGLVLALASLGWSLGSWLQGRFRASTPADRSRLVVLGSASISVGVAGLAVLTAIASPVWAFAVPMVLCGLGMGTASTTLSVLLLDLAPEREHGRASAALLLADVLGSVVGIALCTLAYGLAYRPGEVGAFVGNWVGLTVVAAFAVLTGARCRPSTNA